VIPIDGGQILEAFHDNAAVIASAVIRQTRKTLVLVFQRSAGDDKSGNRTWNVTVTVVFRSPRGSNLNLTLTLFYGPGATSNPNPAIAGISKHEKKSEQASEEIGEVKIILRNDVDPGTRPREIGGRNFWKDWQDASEHPKRETAMAIEEEGQVTATKHTVANEGKIEGSDLQNSDGSNDLFPIIQPLPRLYFRVYNFVFEVFQYVLPGQVAKLSENEGNIDRSIAKNMNIEKRISGILLCLI
jgi:hypothetical protein